ncbi:unnamed protein product [Durusdinium trenchii]|uniref:DNA-directed RNA polymerase I subunit RPA43 n=1 Tax=Durusdinium trenchii TaxID=1381693 RepID=A0ABP0S0G4_9DINO
MPFGTKAFQTCPEVELLRKEYISFENAADALENAVGCRKTSDASTEELLQGRDTLDVSTVSYGSIEMAAKSLREDWTTWPAKLRPRRSPFLLVTGRLEINLHPLYLNNLGKGLRVQAGRLLFRWVEELQCIPLGFQELTPAGKYGAVVTTSPFVHFYMVFKAVAFAPKKDDWLMGRLCQVQIEDGMNITLAGLFNCFIKASNLPSGFRFCSRTKRWLDVRASLPENERGEVQGAEPDRVYLRLTADALVDKFQQSGKLCNFRAKLGWPPEEVPRLLKEVQAREKEEARRQKQRPSSKVAGSGDGPEEASKPKRKLADEDPSAASGKKKRLRQMASTPPKAEKEETTSAPSPRKKQKLKEEPKVKEEEVSPAEIKEVLQNGDRKSKKKEAASSAKQKPEKEAKGKTRAKSLKVA